MFELAVFDIAGTTVRDDQFVAAAFQSALRHYDIEHSLDHLGTVMGLPKPIAISQIVGLPREDPKVIAIHEKFLVEMTRFYETDPRLEPLPMVEETFSWLRKQGVRVALDTGFDRAITNLIFTRLGWDDQVIDGSITSDEVERGRPHPDMIHALMERFGVTSSRAVIKAGDTVSDVQEGKNAVCGLVIGVLTGADTEATLRAQSPDLIFTKLADLRGYDLSELFAQAATRE